MQLACVRAAFCNRGQITREAATDPKGMRSREEARTRRPSPSRRGRIVCPECRGSGKVNTGSVADDRGDGGELMKRAFEGFGQVSRTLGAWALFGVIAVPLLSCVYLGLGCFTRARSPLPTLLPGPLFPPVVPGLSAEASPVRPPADEIEPVAHLVHRHAHRHRSRGRKR